MKKNQGQELFMEIWQLKKNKQEKVANPVFVPSRISSFYFFYLIQWHEGLLVLHEMLYGFSF